MSALSRIAPTLSRSSVLCYRQMASVTSTEPIRKVFVDKIRDFNLTNKVQSEVEHQFKSKSIHIGAAPMRPQLASLSQPYALTRLLTIQYPSLGSSLQNRPFHASGSKVKYLDFRYRYKTNRFKVNILSIRRAKMKKHKRRKWRRKFKSLLAKRRLKREIKKEKTFRVEMLTMIRRAENFDAKEFALKRIAEINSRPIPKTRQENFMELKEKIRVNRYQTDYIKPVHKRADVDEEIYRRIIEASYVGARRHNQ